MTCVLISRPVAGRPVETGVCLLPPALVCGRLQCGINHDEICSIYSLCVICLSVCDTKTQQGRTVPQETPLSDIDWPVIKEDCTFGCY